MSKPACVVIGVNPAMAPRLPERFQIGTRVVALLRALPFVEEEGLTFSRELRMSAGTEATTFGHTGKARRNEGRGSDRAGGDGERMEEFYGLPKRVKS